MQATQAQKLQRKKEIFKLKENIDEQKLIAENRGFPGGAVVENLPANAGDMGSRPGLGGYHMPWSN